MGNRMVADNPRKCINTRTVVTPRNRRHHPPRPERSRMDVVKTLPPGQPGTQRFQRKYGERLVLVRYRHDAVRQRRLTTVELIVDEAPFHLRRSVDRELLPHSNGHVYVRIAYGETDLRQKVSGWRIMGCGKKALEDTPRQSRPAGIRRPNPERLTYAYM